MRSWRRSMKLGTCASRRTRHLRRSQGPIVSCILKTTTSVRRYTSTCRYRCQKPTHLLRLNWLFVVRMHLSQLQGLPNKCLDLNPRDHSWETETFCFTSICSLSCCYWVLRALLRLRKVCISRTSLAKPAFTSRTTTVRLERNGSRKRWGQAAPLLITTM